MIEFKAPSLLQRDGDLQLLVRHFVTRFAQQFGEPITSLTCRASDRAEYAPPQSSTGRRQPQPA